MIVTCWYRAKDHRSTVLEFNHYSLGFHEDHLEPPYMFESQRIAWVGQYWIGRQAQLVDGKIIGGELQ